ncbi:MAG TPA: c-type cytochrome [Stellaceae bacterium]|nr:c-type cytochrome [Stellaceae bacterium]
MRLALDRGILGTAVCRAMLLGATLAFAPAAPAQLVASPRLGDPARGAKAFVQCQRCHSLDPGANMAGPSLHGIFGRKAGSAAGYRYSPAMRRSKVIWDEDTLSEYLANPRKFSSRAGRSVGCRIADPGRLGDLLAYLEQAAK